MSYAIRVVEAYPICDHCEAPASYHTKTRLYGSWSNKCHLHQGRLGVRNGTRYTIVDTEEMPNTGVTVSGIVDDNDDVTCPLCDVSRRLDDHLAVYHCVCGAEVTINEQEEPEEDYEAN